jgi:hypothetical protein
VALISLGTAAERSFNPTAIGDVRHIRKKDTPKLSRSACTPLQIVIVFDSVHRLSQNAGLQQQTITDIYCRAGAGPGNLSSYEEIRGVWLVVGS